MKLFLVLLLATPLYGQTWFKVASESSTTSITIPINTTIRFGLGTCWSSTQTNTRGPSTFALYWPTGQIGINPDPCPGVVKELDVMETSVTQNITVVINGKSSVVTVPALPPAPAVTYTFNCPATMTGTITITSAGVATITASNVTLTQPCNGIKP